MSAHKSQHHATRWGFTIDILAFRSDQGSTANLPLDRTKYRKPVLVKASKFVVIALAVFVQMSAQSSRVCVYRSS